MVGEVHPPGRALAYPKYLLSEGGVRRILNFYSVPHVEETIKLLENRYPQYLFHNSFSSLRFPAVPSSLVKTHYKPEEGLRRILSLTGDPLEAKASRLAALLAERSGVPLENFGVTGSILLEIHHPSYSDIDLTVYGLEASLKVREALLNLYGSLGVERLKGGRLKRWCEEKARLHPLTLREAEEIYRRTWSRGLFEGTFFSVHPVRADWEVGEAYGERRFKSGSLVEVEATILQAREALFLPAVYLIGEVEALKGRLEGEPCELVSFEGLYSGVFEAGEKVRIRGLLERVENLKNGRIHWRILVGSRLAGGSDYVKPCQPSPR